MNSTVRTKLLIPRIEHDLAPRPRLMQRLDRSLSTRVTLVSAPAGYGKTSTVASWLHSLVATNQPPVGEPPARALRAAWYSLDPDDDNFSTFFTRFTYSLEAASPGAFSHLPSGMEIVGLAAEAYGNALADACLRLPSQVVCVLDDYHLIRDPAIHAVILHLVQYASDTLHLVLLTRYDPPLRLNRLRAQQQLTEVRAVDLRMSDVEAAALLELRLDTRPSPSLIAELQLRTEGWAAGLQLAAVALHGDPDLAHFVDELRRDVSRYAADYLLDEVLAREPENVRLFLLHTALTSRFCAELAAHLTGFSESSCQQIIGRLRDEDLFVVELDKDQHWFRYHRQFQAMLVDRARLALSPREIDELREAAARWLAANDYIEEALSEYIANRQWTAAAELVDSRRHSLYDREEWHLQWRWLTLVPEGSIERHPGLLLARAWILQIQRRNAAIVPIVQRIAAILGEQSIAGDEEQVSIWRGELLALQGSWVFAARSPGEKTILERRALDLLPAHKCAWVRGFAVNQLVEAMVRGGQRETIVREIQSELDSAIGANRVYVARLLLALCSAVFMDGSLAELEQTGHLYMQHANQSGIAGAVLWARLALGWVYSQRRQPELAWQMIEPLFERTLDANQLALTIALDVIVDAGAELGKLDLVASFLERTRKVTLERENFAAVEEVKACAARAALLRGEPVIALEWAEQFLSTWDRFMELQAGHAFTAAPFVCAEVALVCASPGLLRRVVQPLEVLANSSRDQHIAVQSIRASYLLACCYWRIGQAGHALRWLQHAVEVGVPRGFRRIFFSHAGDLPAMLQALAQRGMASPDSERLLAEYTAWATALERPLFAAPPHNLPRLGILTEREMEVILLLGQGLSNKEIARRLGISPITVRNHTSSIYGKLSVATRRQAIAQAQRLGLLVDASTRSQSGGLSH